jgi:hypothetical protein
MNFVEPRPDLEAAARKLMAIANSVAPVPDGRIHNLAGGGRLW